MSNVDDLAADKRAGQESMRSGISSDMPTGTAGNQHLPGPPTGERMLEADIGGSTCHSLPKFTRDEVSMHYEEGDCWIVIAGKVYDVTPFLDTHPGGIDVIMEYAGLDATSDFEDLPHPPEAYEMLQKYLKGVIVASSE